MVPGKNLKKKANKLNSWGFGGIAIFADYKSWDCSKLDELCSLYDKTGMKPFEFVFIDSLYGHLMDIDKNVSKKAFDMHIEEKSLFIACGQI